VHEIYAGFGECARWDGLVERVTKYADDARHVVVEVGAAAVLLAIICALSTCTLCVAASMKLLQA
jgi:hypothetical protein